MFTLPKNRAAAKPMAITTRISESEAITLVLGKEGEAFRMESSRSFFVRDLVGSILAKTNGSGEIKDLKLVSFLNLYRCLSEKEISFIKIFLNLSPRKYGFKGKFLGIKKIPKNLIAIDGQYLPRPIYSIFQEMNLTLENDMGGQLLVESGYRSPAFQAVLFLRNLKSNEFNFFETVRTVAFPGYSEHGDFRRQAIDFSTNGVSAGKPFEKTKEYKWLRRNAHKFNFFLSYPKGNKEGVRFEPWHWRFGK